MQLMFRDHDWFTVGTKLVRQVKELHGDERKCLRAQGAGYRGLRPRASRSPVGCRQQQRSSSVIVHMTIM